MYIQSTKFTTAVARSTESAQTVHMLPHQVNVRAAGLGLTALHAPQLLPLAFLPPMPRLQVCVCVRENLDGGSRALAP